MQDQLIISWESHIYKILESTAEALQTGDKQKKGSFAKKMSVFIYLPK